MGADPDTALGAALVVQHSLSCSSGVRVPPEALAQTQWGTQAHTCTRWARSARYAHHVHTQRWGLPCNRPVSGRDNAFPCGNVSHPVPIVLAFPCMLRDPGFTAPGCSPRGPHPSKIPSLWKRSSPLKPWPQVEQALGSQDIQRKTQPATE